MRNLIHVKMIQKMEFFPLCLVFIFNAGASVKFIHLQTKVHRNENSCKQNHPSIACRKLIRVSSKFLQVVRLA